MDERKTKRDEEKKDSHYCKSIGKMMYFWRPYHNGNNGQWVIHKPSKCCNKMKQKDNDNKDNSGQTNMTAVFDMVDSNCEE